MADQGNGATVAFGTSSFTGEIIEIGELTQSRAMLSKNHLGSTGPMKKRAAKQYDAGGYTIRGYYNPNTQPPIEGAEETVTITYPVPSGGSAGATEAGTAQVSEWTRGKLISNEMMEFTCTVTYTGVTGPTFTDST